MTIAALPRRRAAADPLDLPPAELAAAVLDGELYRLVGAFRPMDAPPDAGGRAAAVLDGMPPRVIVERWSAAWVWGALGDPPRERFCCVSLRERARPARHPTVQLREVAIARREIAAVGGRLVTTPARTLVDLARDEGPWDPALGTAVCRVGGLDPLVVADGLRRAGGRLAGRRRALGRLAALSRC